MKGEEMTTMFDEPVATTINCKDCGRALVGYAFDGTVLFEEEHCEHLTLCTACVSEIEKLWGDQVLGYGCPICRSQKHEFMP